VPECRGDDEKILMIEDSAQTERPLPPGHLGLKDFIGAENGLVGVSGPDNEYPMW